MSIFVIDTDDLTLVHTDSDCDPTSTQVNVQQRGGVRHRCCRLAVSAARRHLESHPGRDAGKRFCGSPNGREAHLGRMQPATHIDTKANGCDQSETSGAAASVEDFVIRNATHLKTTLTRHFAYCYSSGHLGLAKQCPFPRQPSTVGRIVEIPQVGGLHHRYERVAA